MKRKLTDTQIIVLGFLVIILVGAGLLCLPAATRTGQSTPFSDALLTASSATCVTGLIAYDTFTHWSTFGQIVILLLIQIGGLGFVTVAVLFSLVMQKKIGLKERTLIQESINATQLGGTVRIIRLVLIGTFSAEIFGGILLAFRFCPELGLGRGIYYAIFHAISAFCNAGFDLMGYIAPYSSMTNYASDVYVNVVLMVLIVIGGLGFFVWQDILENKLRFRKYRLHTKIVLCVSAVLIVIPAVCFFFLERDASMAGMNTGEAILASAFQSVTCRTAGMNTVDQAALTPASSILSMLLMLTGGSPGSTAGGIKTTTVFIVILSVLCTMRRQKHVQCFGRRIREELVGRAVAIVLTYVAVLIVSVAAISIAENAPLQSILFEVASAIGTVGLTAGLTPTLHVFSKVLLSVLMLFGRVGGLSMAMALANFSKPSLTQLPIEDVPVG